MVVLYIPGREVEYLSREERPEVRNDAVSDLKWQERSLQADVLHNSVDDDEFLRAAPSASSRSGVLRFPLSFAFQAAALMPSD